MRSYEHVLTNVDEGSRKADCRKCGPVSVVPNGVQSGRRRLVCYYARSAQLKPHRKHLKQTCEECGFVPQHPSQLDVDHIDGDKTNGDPLNLRTLCANCHRLKTALNGDSTPKHPRYGGQA